MLLPFIISAVMAFTPEHSSDNKSKAKKVDPDSAQIYCTFQTDDCNMEDLQLIGDGNILDPINNPYAADAMKNVDPLPMIFDHNEEKVDEYDTEASEPDGE